ncbi:hypothetical protein HDU98_002947 [Podochytrium sp. JEL0797]|nr:hypothetical protein HDU98_002947 [Podochytrium sp. JEL0797]
MNRVAAQGGLPLVTEKPFKLQIIPHQTEDMTVHWARFTLLAIFVVSLTCIAFEAWIMATRIPTFLAAMESNGTPFSISDVAGVDFSGGNNTANVANFVAGVTYHSVFILSVVFLAFITWNGVMHQNSLQIIFINFYLVALFIFSITQVFQTESDLQILYETTGDTAANDKGNGGFLVSHLPLPIILGLYIPCFAYLTTRLRMEFGWRMYRITGGDKKIRKKYHILLLLSKFAFCFLFCFTSLDLVASQFVLAKMIAFPIFVGCAGAAVSITIYFAVTYESRKLMLLSGICCLIAVAYVTQRFCALISVNGTIYQKLAIPYIMYGSTSIVLLVACCLFGCLCTLNFGHGLREVLSLEVQLRNGSHVKPEINLDA